MRKFLAFLLTLALVFPLILAAQTLVSINSFILDRNFYIQTMDNDQVYESLLSNGMLSATIEKYLTLPPDADLAKVEEIIKSVITHDYIKDQTGIFINGLFDYLQGKTDNFTPVVNLVPVKAALAGEKQNDLLAAIAAILPVCEPGQIPGIDIGNQKACKPAGISDDVLVENYLKSILPFALAQVPDEVPIGEKWDEIRITRNWGPFASGMALPASLMLVSVFLAFMAASFWYIAALIADESWRVRLQWLGWTLMIPSSLIFLVGLAFSADIPNYWVNLSLDRANFNGLPFGSGIHEALRAVVRGSFSRVAASFIMVGGISGAIGLGLIFWGLATPRKSRS
ncbi:MAG: hypothetical protein MUO42_06730 [Anaerolineaceae bacterium]|nr:hypothetical protein [Anaerolineaceae bacterium]